MRWRRIRWSDVMTVANVCRKNVDAGRSLGSDFVFRIWGHGALTRQAPKHGVNPLRRQLRSPIEPPGQHGHVGSNDILNDKFARDDVRGILVDGSGEFLAHQIRKYLANAAKGDGAARGRRPMLDRDRCGHGRVRTWSG